MEVGYPRMYLYRRLVQAKLFIEQHYDEAIDLNAIADTALFSKFHFIRLYKSVYGKTPHQYLMQVRIQKSRLLLEQGQTIALTCYTVGFDSVTSFSALFKKYTTQTPLAYQQQYQRRQADMVRQPLKYVPNCFAEKKGWV